MTAVGGRKTLNITAELCRGMSLPMKEAASLNDFRMREHRRNVNTGAVLLETALALPVMLLIIWLLIWLSSYIFAQATLSDAVSMGARLGVVQARQDLMNRPFLSGLSEWQEAYLGPGSQEPGGRLQSFLVHGAPVDFSLYDSYTTAALGVKFQQVPASYIVTIMLINEAMRLGVGNIRYPCDPRGASGDGCLLCKFGQGSSGSSGTTGSGGPSHGHEPPSGQPAEPLTWQAMMKTMEIQCDYAPTSTALRASTQILGTSLEQLLQLRQKFIASFHILYEPSMDVPL